MPKRSRRASAPVERRERSCNCQSNGDTPQVKPDFDRSFGTSHKFSGLPHSLRLLKRRIFPLLLWVQCSELFLWLLVFSPLLVYVDGLILIYYSNPPLFYPSSPVFSPFLPRFAQMGRTIIHTLNYFWRTGTCTTQNPSNSKTETEFLHGYDPFLRVAWWSPS